MVAPKLRILQRTRQGDNVYFLILSYLFLCIQSISYEIQLGLIGLKFQCLQKDIWTTSSICTVKFNRPQLIKLNWPYITNMQQNSTNTATNFQVAIVYAVSVRQNWAFPGLSLNFRIFNAFTNSNKKLQKVISATALPEVPQPLSQYR